MKRLELLAARHISKSFGTVRALNDVSIELNEGELLSVVGENGAGKSTLMNIITGIHQPDAGEILVNGRQVAMKTPLDAIRSGISIVHQELVNCPDITVAENIFLSAIVNSGNPWINYKELNRKAEELLRWFDGKVNPGEKMGNLSVSEQQIVEIAKAMATNARVIIFDEPTSSLTEDEVKKLFEIIRRLKKEGIGILYISHRMSEIFELSDRVSVLRDGVLVDTLPIGELDQDTIVSKMTGRDIGDHYPPKAQAVGDVIFRAEDYSAAGQFEHVSFALRRGEILGFSGLIGAGRSELMKAIVGIEPSQSGQVTLEGRQMRFTAYARALQEGIVYLTEDRKQEGLYLMMDIQKNMSILNIRSISGRLLVDDQKAREQADKFARLVNIKCSGLEQISGTLSGGNQQKILIGNALSISPKLIILDEPTKGIDVGAKAEIYAHLRKLANEGVGIIVISSDLPEIIGLCDRALVMYEGRLCGEVTGEAMNEHSILQLAAGF
ncbi:MAG: sugar ABC transporter ATP-binding protein [Candidatus Ventricola sp.]